jgi:CRISPR-associated endonuclease/helicase Cas3
LPGEPPDKWETLDTHAAAVAKLAREFANAFKAGDWGELLGRWHDLGKSSTAFQNYLHQSQNPDDAGENESAPGKIDHSTFGARYAEASVKGLFGQLLAFCIAGHHAGLADDRPRDDASARATLQYKLDPARYAIEPVTIADQVAPLPLKIDMVVPTADEVGFALAFFTRMLFSALVDADRTATEAFCDVPQSIERQKAKPSLESLRSALDSFLEEKQRTATGQVNAIRASVLRECIAASSLAKGFFSLNVPTGGGKTFASLAFALHHAKAFPQFRRVVVAIPFTSIIEQTADQYRQALGSLSDLGLIEHHSNLHPKRDTRQNKLASENWDAPLIVTTNVQLYESLFAAAGTPCRKLHRLANSVIILDEAQTIPVDLLTPTLAALRELVTRYGCTVVLCTATQPALEYRTEDFKIGLKNVRPIIQDAPALHRQLKRVEVTRLGVQTDEALIERLAAEHQALCVVNTKAHAASLFEALVAHRGKKTGCYHLSTMMCAQHRRDVLATIRQRLAQEKSCRIISTQLIEAGVDIDLPVVYRAPAGFDSIAQAAGRCNREGKLASPGKVYVFETEKLPPPGMLRNSAQVAAELAPDHPDPLAPSAVEAYFKMLYWSRAHDWDKHEVMPCFDYNHQLEQHKKLVPLQFRTAAANYKIIREEQTPILVPYDKAAAMIAHLRGGGLVDYSFYRDAQRYTVSVRDDLLRRLVNNASLFQHESGLWTLENSAGYSPEQGMLPNAVGLSPEALMM